MGKQLGFYLTFDEEDEVLKDIKSMQHRIINDKGIEISSFDRVGGARCYIIIKEGNIKKYNEASEYMDSISSDIIEFRRTEYSQLRGAEPGRIWTELRYWDKNGELKSKGQELDDLYKQIAKLIKQKTKKIDGSPFYISQKSRDYIAENNLKIY